MKAVAQVATAVLKSADVRKATVYLSPSMVVKATRHNRPRKGERSVTLVVTVGKPNYAERKFIKACHASLEPFPVKKVQIKGWPKAKKRR